MKERPILFSAPMVQAIREGRKTQTRRVCKASTISTSLEGVDGGVATFSRLYGDGPGHEVQEDVYQLRCPYGKPGDRLWVREGFKRIASGEVKNGYGEVRYGFAYKADGATIWAPRTTIIHDLSGQPDTGPMQFQPRPWKPSIHMPRIASRILLEVTDVRVERLQDISEEDVIAEGRLNEIIYGTGWYRGLWESIDGAGSWDVNPWVWCVSFKMIES